jgi:hypothetical protein
MASHRCRGASGHSTLSPTDGITSPPMDERPADRACAAAAGRKRTPNRISKCSLRETLISLLRGCAPNIAHNIAKRDVCWYFLRRNPQPAQLTVTPDVSARAVPACGRGCATASHSPRMQEKGYSWSVSATLYSEGDIPIPAYTLPSFGVCGWYGAIVAVPNRSTEDRARWTPPPPPFLALQARDTPTTITPPNCKD